MSYPLSHIAQLMGAQQLGTSCPDIEWLLTDSRTLTAPENTLFFALRTRTGDGHRYLSALYQRGVRAFVVGTLPEGYDRDYADASFLLVPSPLKALQLLAEQHRRSLHLPVVGITGSNGKTIVKEWLYQLFDHAPSVVRSPRSYNSQVGVPLSVWMLNAQSEVGIFEAGISEPREMSSLRHIIRPTLGILTNIGGAHQEHFATLEEKCLEKLKLFKHAEALIYCADHDIVLRCLSLSDFAGQHLAWSRTKTDAPICITVCQEGNSTTIAYTGLLGEGRVVIPFGDEASIENAIHALLAARYLGLSAEVVASRAAQLQAVAMRLEVKQGMRGLTLIDDAYNSDLTSLHLALDFLVRRGCGRGRTLILSDLQQTGLDSVTLYTKVAQLLRQHSIDRLIAIGQELSQHQHLFEGKTHFFETTQQLLKSPLLEQLHSDIVLLKGARDFHFETIAERLQLKLHETTLHVDLAALADNVRHYRAYMRPDTKLVCMVKASAYGSGSIEVARTLQDLGVDYLAVAVADEGAELRKAGITAGIIIMNPELSALSTLFKYRLEPEVYNFRLLDALIAAARQEGITHYPVHLKLDTGMCRLGFNPDHDLPQLIERLQGQQALAPRSVFSHFVGSDSPEFDTFTHEQFARFDRASLRLQEALPHSLLRHICNSAGIARFPQYHLDMCRLGLGLYGIDPVTNAPLANVATLRTTILQIRHIEAGTSVGYSRRSTVSRPSRIAALPIGYADGLDRHLGNGRGHCWVNGKLAPYIGNICMDVCMIDVTDIDCREGDAVEIFGEHLPISTVAEWLDTIPYEVLTSVSERVKRVYVQ